jgi:hypothetical protein
VESDSDSDIEYEYEISTNEEDSDGFDEPHMHGLHHDGRPIRHDYIERDEHGHIVGCGGGDPDW